eukprot:jgi/Botrbrau1/1523/Bobra.0107s0011.1
MASNGNIWRVAIVLVFGVSVAILLFGFNVENRDKVRQFLYWMQQHLLIGAACFTILYCGATVLCIPGSLLSLGAGYVFGLAFGALVVWLGASSGAALAFLLGRFLFREKVAKIVHQSDTWHGVDIALQEEGWKLMLLLRLSPVVPFSLLNYGLGVTPVSFFSYVLTTCVGILPGTLMYVYAGSLAKSIEEIVSGKRRISPWVTLGTTVVSGVFIIAAGVLTARYARRAIARKMERERHVAEDFGSLTDDEESPPPSSSHAPATQQPLLG